MEMKLILAVGLTLAFAQSVAEQLTVTRAMEMYEDYETVDGNFTLPVEEEKPVEDLNVVSTPEPEPVVEEVKQVDTLTESPDIVVPPARKVDTFGSVTYVPELSIDAKKDLQRQKHQSLSQGSQFIRGRRYDPPELFEAPVQQASAVTKMDLLWEGDADLITPQFASDSALVGIEDIAVLAESIAQALEGSSSSFLSAH